MNMIKINNKEVRQLLDNKDINLIKYLNEIDFKQFDEEERKYARIINGINNEYPLIELPWYTHKIHINELSNMLVNLLLTVNTEEPYCLNHEKLQEYVNYINLYFNLGIDTKSSFDSFKLMKKIEQNMRISNSNQIFLYTVLDELNLRNTDIQRKLIDLHLLAKYKMCMMVLEAIGKQ